MRLVSTLLVFALYVSLSRAQKKKTCVKEALRRHLGKCPDVGKPCKDTCGDGKTLDITTKSECDKHSDCCFKDDKCVRFEIPATSRGSDDDRSSSPDDFVGSYVEDDNNNGGDDDNDDAFKSEYQRHFGDSTPITCNTDRFPYNCRTESYASNNLKCTVDIPYCMRVPCLHAVSQHDVENSPLACTSHPGCCFDEELSNYRRSFGQRVLPGVPVCHYAIRNHVFQKHATRYTESFGGWNPMLTSCLIESNKETIFGDSAGCYMVTVIEYFGLRARQAGWKGISPLDCHLIDGCYRPGKGCVYPFDPTEGVKLKANDPYSQETTAYAPQHGQSSNVYQRYTCQTFRNTKDPYSYLKTYHQCLSSGCSLDVSTHDLYLKHLWNVSQTLSPRGRDLYWKGVMAFEIRADNFLDELAKYKEVYDDPEYDSPLLPFEINSTPLHTFPPPTHLQYQAPPQDIFRQFSQPPSDNDCPFKKPHVQNFPPLKGSFTGCCEKPLCYFSSQKIRAEKLYSELTYYYSSWSAWSKCSASCGGGKYRRVRQCISHNQVTSKGGCDGQEEIKDCNVAACPHWAQWSEYGACTVTCGGGRKIRRRYCVGKRCYGPGSESLPCSQTKCELATQWSLWSRCSTSCGKGYQARARKCIDDCPENFKGTDNRICERYCGNIVWGAWTQCDEETCTMERTAACLYGKNLGHCRTKPVPAKSLCTRNPCYCKRYPDRCRQNTVYQRPPVVHQMYRPPPNQARPRMVMHGPPHPQIQRRFHFG